MAAPALARVMVPVKRVVDYAVKIRVRPDGSGVETANVKHSMNPFDEIAVTEAVKLKEKKLAGEVIAVSIGSKKCHETLRNALAMGADRAVHVDVGEAGEALVEPLGVARLLRALMAGPRLSGTRLVLVGKQAIDDDSGHVGALLAGGLGWAQASCASALELPPGAAQLRVTREVDGGLETLLLKLPAVVSCDLRLNTPKRTALPAILAANKKPLDVVAAAELLPAAQWSAPRARLLQVRDPPTRQAGVKVDSPEALLDRLRQHGFSA